ncbi:hypothetical protein K469DRAFT_791431 [Zopfia rhizophila CBS 207.26]|uniref:Uncharacterized protein n=1 Tax=Zopfia rhizophila CBS 207.26 TaxID=1314779 RepID=A0A6A6DUB3_9PEZI|nr:hypothetical protein K469DRAFT_791431 [Zopfia rhizophila CBS 207.26]
MARKTNSKFAQATSKPTAGKDRCKRGPSPSKGLVDDTEKATKRQKVLSIVPSDGTGRADNVGSTRKTKKVLRRKMAKSLRFAAAVGSSRVKKKKKKDDIQTDIGLSTPQRHNGMDLRAIGYNLQRVKLIIDHPQLCHHPNDSASLTGVNLSNEEFWRVAKTLLGENAREKERREKERREKERREKERRVRRTKLGQVRYFWSRLFVVE